MNPPLDIEQPEPLLAYLREQGRIGAEETPHLTPLHGGVSNRTVLLERPNGEAWVLKQALEKLRVAAEWHSDPRRIHQEALGLHWLARLAPEGTITPLLFQDTTHHLLAMQAVPQPHENWKTRLLAGGLDSEHVAQFGTLLGTLHRASAERSAVLSREFADRTFFETLRLEPYYRFTAERHPVSGDFFARLIDDTLAVRAAVVHGDYSPKNILVHRGKLILLDHEVIHYGDPAFDLGFSLTHLLSKAHHLAALRGRFFEAAAHYWRTYLAAAEPPASPPAFEARAVRHTLGCLLARVDGRSPLEYLTVEERDRQRGAVLAILARPPTRIEALIDTFGRHLG